MLKFLGNGFVAGIPTRDLTEEEVKELAKERQQPELKRLLIASGLYEQKMERPQREDKALRPLSEDKEYEED